MVRVGVVGYGALGQYLVQQVQEREELSLAWVWNRTSLAGRLPEDLVLEHLEDCGRGEPQVIVEVAHPDITRQYGASFLKVADFMMGSPTALADADLEASLRSAASLHGLYVPQGALWGGEDIRRMAERGSLRGLTVTMTFPPASFKLRGELAAKNAAVTDTAVELYHGPVRALCPLAPNNVNTMAAAAVAATGLGFDGTMGRLVADPGGEDWHTVQVDVEGPEGPGGNRFAVRTVRSNPANPGAVTGSATYASFLSSLLRVGGKGPGLHLC